MYGKRLVIDAKDVSSQDFSFESTLDSVDVLIIEDEYMENQLLPYDHFLCLTAQDFSNLSTLAFTNWCNYFFHEDFRFEIIQLPYFLDIAYHYDYIWKTRGDDNNCFKNQGNDICFDSYIDEVSLNKYLLDNKIVVALRVDASYGSARVILDAIIPNHGKYYRYRNDVFWSQKINSNYFENVNIDMVREVISKDISRFIDNNGRLYEQFNVTYFQWAFDSMGDHKLQMLNIDPRKDNITIKSLFYDND